jgi:asparagine synthase (glutamine-hydrolysing)
MNDGLIANLLLARSIGSEITVAITGDGGDHTFAGTWVHLGDAMAQRVPRPLAPVGAWVTDAGHALTRNRTARRLSKGFHGARIPQRSRWLAMRRHDMPGRHPGLLATDAWRVNGFDPDEEALAYYDRCTAPDHLSRVIYAETRWDLPPNDMLKVDRACAYAGMAGRSPFFDRRVVEFASSLPAEWKIQGRTLKPLGREVARRRLPPEIATLPKTGLSTPMRDWMRGPFGERVGRLLASDSFASRGIFDPKGAQTVLERHRAGRGDYAHVAWTMAVTELFFRSFVDTFAMPDERVWE